MSIARLISKLGAMLGSDGKVPAAGIADSAVTAAKVADGAINNAKLGSSGRFTTQFNARSSTHSLGGDSGWVDHLSMSFTTSQIGPLLVLYHSSSSYESGAVEGFARLLVDGNVIGYPSCVAKQSTANSAGSGSLSWDIQTLSAGSHTVKVQLRNTNSGTIWQTPYWGNGTVGASNILGIVHYA